MAGVSRIAAKMTARCPHCGRALDVSQLPSALFRRISEYLTRGEMVEIERFGRFKPFYVKPRPAAGSVAKVSVIPGHWRLRFKASSYLREAINEALGKQQTRRKQWRKKKAPRSS